MSNLQEYLAGTNPNDPNSDLEITGIGALPGGTLTTVVWESVLTRNYYVLKRTDIGVGTPWVDSGLGLISPDGASTMRTITDTNAPARFYRVQAVKPLSP